MTEDAQHGGGDAYVRYSDWLTIGWVFLALGALLNGSLVLALLAAGTPIYLFGHEFRGWLRERRVL